MIERIVSGGQTGADRAGWFAAEVMGIPTAGFMPRGFKAEDGNHPGFAERFGAKATANDDYPSRTAENAKLADATVWFGRNDSRGFGCTMNACRKASKPSTVIDDPKEANPASLAAWMKAFGYKTLNVAGNRASTSPAGFGDDVRCFLLAVLIRIEMDRWGDESRPVEVDYTNWRGVRSVRVVHPVPGKLKQDSNRWHPERQWMVGASDDPGGDLKSFALAGIHRWRTLD